MLAEPILYELTEAGAVVDITYTNLEINNQADNIGNQLPLTGGAGIAAISILGLVLIGGGFTYYMVRRRKEQVAA